MADGAVLARVGPNVAIQTFAAVRVLRGEAAARDVAAGAGLADWVDLPPADMIPEAAAARIFTAVHAACGGEAPAVMAEAGRRTADYVLANRIPPPVRAVLPWLPDALAGRILLSAIARNAWTFAGSGGVATGARPFSVEIVANPLAEPGGCAWHAGVFERLFRVLVHP